MDKYNLFFTRTIYNVVRLEYLVMLIGLSLLVLAHWSEVNWIRFIVAFAWSDLVGTFPGLYWYYKRTSPANRAVPSTFYHLYNFGHSFIAVGVITAIWYALTGRFEWAMLAMPIHLLGDRAIFGNIYKASSLEFEPVPNQEFRRFLDRFRDEGRRA